MWVKVEDRLPEAGERCIVFGEDIGVASLIMHISLHGEWVDQLNHTAPYQKTITHWMPLPEPPKDE